MTKIRFLVFPLVLALTRWSSSQPLGCEPCVCHHYNYTLTVTCMADGLQNFDWEQLPHLETFATFMDSDSVAFHLLPAIWRNLTTEIRIIHSSLDDLDLMGYYVVRDLYIEEAKIQNGKVLHPPSSLHHLSIIKSSLTDFDFPMEHVLRGLDLSVNQLTKIPIIAGLQTLTMRNNSLLSFATTLCQPMEHLSSLDLSYNRIGDIPENAFKCISLPRFPMTINLSHNNIRTINERAFSGILLEKLDLSYNKLQVIGVAVLDFHSIAHLDLQNNPWICDCSAQWLLDELMPELYKSTPSLLYDFRCQNPKKLRDRSLAFWYNHSSEAFCADPSALSYSLPYSENTYELFTGQVIVCIALGCLIICLLISILAVWLWPKKKKVTRRHQQPQGKPRPLSSNPRYSHVVSDEEKF